MGQDSFYAEEAARRGLTIDACRKLIAQQSVTAPTFNPPANTAQRSEFEVLSYETGLSTSFVAKFQEAAEKLNIGPAESRRIILSLSGELKDLPRNGWYATTYQRLGRIDDGQRLLNQLISLVNQQDVEHAVTTVTSSMREGRRGHRRYLAETFRIPVRMALLFDGKVRSEVEILGYETGLSTEFLGEFQRAALSLNVVGSLPIIMMLSGKLTDFEWLGPAERRLNDIGAQGLRRELVRLMKVGDVQAAAELVLKAMKGEDPATRRYIAQTFGIPESTVLIYDELQRLRKGMTGSSN